MDVPIVRFYQLIPSAPLPGRADRTAFGTLPVNAVRFCEPASAASAFGWYVYPPMDFSIMHDGEHLLWSFGNQNQFEALSINGAQYPGFLDYFNQHAPERLRDYSPQLIIPLIQPGFYQIWSGVIARTRPGWSLLSRAVANFKGTHGYEIFEGIIETDRWFGPLFTNIKITRTDEPIEFKRDIPLFQVQALPREIYSAQTLQQFECATIDDFGDEEWELYERTVVKPNLVEHRELGGYATEARARAQQDRKKDQSPESSS